MQYYLNVHEAIIFFLQVLGASLYATNKYFLSKEEDKIAWVIYMIGALPVCYLLWIRGEMVYFGLEAMSILMAAYSLGKAFNKMKTTPWQILAFGTCFGILGWTAHGSLEKHGFQDVMTYVEIAGTLAFLMGTMCHVYDKRVYAGILYIVMHCCSIAVFSINGYWVLMVFQIISIGFAINGIRRARRASHNEG